MPVVYGVYKCYESDADRTATPQSAGGQPASIEGEGLPGSTWNCTLSGHNRGIDYTYCTVVMIYDLYCCTVAMIYDRYCCTVVIGKLLL